MRITKLLVVAAMLLAPARGFATTTYDIDVKLNNSLSYNALDISINFAAANGSFTGSGATVSCTANTSLNALMAFNEVSTVLKAAAMSTTPISGPVVLFTCLFDSNGGAPAANTFVITVTGWESASTNTPPTVQISRIQVH